MDLSAKYQTSKLDITEAWENPIRPSDRITRDWIYGVDMETMSFVKAVWTTVMDGSNSLYETFVAIMQTPSLDELIKKQS